MQVKKFEAPTIQEALETIKRELGPEAIILQTRKNKRGFGLMSQGSVEVTAAVSERALQRKTFTEGKLPEPMRDEVQKLPAQRQADTYQAYAERHLEAGAAATRDRVELSQGPQRMMGPGPSAGQPAARKPQAPAKGAAAQAQGRSITQARYADIQDDGSVAPARAARAAEASAEARAARQPGSAMARVAQASLDAAAQAMATGAAVPVGGRSMPMDQEVQQLKRMIAEMKAAQDEAMLGGGGPVAPGKIGVPALRDAFEQLLLNGVDKRFAIPLIKKVAFELGEERSANPDEVLDQLAAEIMETTQVRSPFVGVEQRSRAAAAPEPVLEGAAAPAPAAPRGPALVALFGPTGVGKTTTIAKIASEGLLRRNLKVGLINLDSYKVAAFDQLATYAKILNVPFRSVTSAEDLKAAVDDFRNLDLVIIDTTGRSQRDPESLKEMKGIVDTVSPRAFLVLSATTRDTELYDMASRFSVFRPEGIVVSKLDEATTYGSIFNVSQRTKLPLVYFTTGQRVPEDIEEATRERVAALIMDL